MIASDKRIYNDKKKQVMSGLYRGVCIHWTGLLDWTTGLDYWTDLRTEI